MSRGNVDDAFSVARFRGQQHVNLYSIVVIGFITLSSAAYGYAAANIATTLTQPSFQHEMGLRKNPNARAITGAINGKSRPHNCAMGMQRS